jgi:hypothetical protein
MEEWRETGYPNYTVSSLGRVKGPSGKILKPSINEKGYFSVSMRYYGIQIKRTVHGLVCRAWHGAPPPSMFQVRHMDGNPAHNTPDNLQWSDQSENEYDKALHGTAGGNRGERHGSHKLTNDKVRQIRRMYGARELNQYQLADYFQVSQGVVSQIISHQLWSHIKDEPEGESSVAK